MRNSKKMPKGPQDTLSTFVIAAIAIFHLAINIYVPCLPSIAESFNAHRDIVQISVGSFIGDALNALLCAVGHNLRMIWRTIRSLFVLFYLWSTSPFQQKIDQAYI